MRRLGRWTVLVLLATSLTGGVAAPASAEAPECQVTLFTGDPDLAIREDKPATLHLDCGWPLEPLTASVQTAPLHGALSPLAWDEEYDEWVFTYDPVDDHVGQDTFALSVSDGTGSTVVTAVIQVSPNRRPSCNQRDAVHDHVRPGDDWKMTLTCDDLDLQDYGDLAAHLATAPEHGLLQLDVAEGQSGLDELTVTYTPDAGFEGSDRFTAGATDGDLADVDDFFLNVSDGPWCRPSEPLEVRAGRTVRVLPLCTSPEWEQLETSVPTAPAHGSTSFVGMAIDYTADPDAAGGDSFTFQATGASGTSNVVTQEVTILPNAAPVCEDASAATPIGSPVAVALACTDSDGDDQDLAIADQPEHGTLGELADGTVTYTPDPGWDGTDSFTYTASDFARTSAPATVSVAVTEEMEPVVDVTVVSQSPSRVARRGLRLVVDPDEPVTARVVVGISSRLADRLDIPRRIGRLRGVEIDERRRVTVELTPRASRAIRSRDRLPVVVDLVARDEWGNATSVEARGVLR